MKLGDVIKKLHESLSILVCQSFKWKGVKRLLVDELKNDSQGIK